MSQHTLSLIADFPVTGAGLRSFPGLYSQYILVIPFFFLPNGHNILLDVTLEQGFLGVVALLAVFVGSFFLLVKSTASESGLSSLRIAIGFSLIIMLIHGLVEDTVYASPTLPFLLILLGLAVAASLPVEQIDNAITNPIAVRVAGVTVLTLAIIMLGWLLASRQMLKSLWAANLGALRMARVELDGWPSGKWVENFNITELQPAESLFKQAQRDGDNRTALYRLGLIAMLDRDYEEAVDHLEAADRLGNPHRGIRKNLAYSYVWTGNFEEARPLLIELDEAQQELRSYNWWWGTQNRPELADRAFLMAKWLASAQEHISE